MKPHTLILKSTTCALLSGALLFSGCASIVNGSNQKVKINSHPGGATVRIDGGSSGVTPTTADLSRKASHRVEISLAGYASQEVMLRPHFNGLMLGNLLIGGIIGMAVDGSTGASNTLKPENLDVTLEKAGAASRRAKPAR